MHTSAGFPLAVARRTAETLLQLLLPACDTIAIAGSIRRGKSHVKDVELVAVPTAATDFREMFPQYPPDPFEQKENQLDELVTWLAEQKRVAWDNSLRRRGRRYKRLLFESLPIDLFIVEGNSFGYQFALRTGPASFSMQLVTSEHGLTRDRRPGLLPDGLRVGDGCLFRGAERLSVPTEEDFFRAIGLTWIPPEKR